MFKHFLTWMHLQLEALVGFPKIGVDCYRGTLGKIISKNVQECGIEASSIGIQPSTMEIYLPVIKHGVLENGP